MLNFFYIYSAIWSIILLFYSFGWSDLCTPLAPELCIFFLLTIIVSFLLGRLLRNKFQFVRVEVPKHRKRTVVVFIVLYCLAEYVYCRQIPIIHILRLGRGYTEFTGIPTLHPLVISLGSFYAQYLIYRFFVNQSDKKALVDYCIILSFIFLFQFNRGGLMISFVMSGLMYLGINKGNIRKRINKKSIALAVILMLVILFGFGVLGNLRHGFSAFNSTYIQKLGRFNDKYPSWLPKQFMWAYIYIVSPIANLNYNIVSNPHHTNVMGYIMTFFPDFIVRRIYSGEINQPILVLKNIFNATSGFGTAYANAGIPGMYFLYFYLMIGLLALWLFAPIRSEYRMPCLAIMNIIVIFMFFTHTIYYSAISFQLVFPLLSFIRVKTSRRS